MPRSRSRSMLSSTCADISRSSQRAGDLEKTVGQRRLAVIDVGDDREVTDVALVHGEWANCLLCRIASILMTGATGYLGRPLTSLRLARGHRVGRLCGRAPSRASPAGPRSSRGDPFRPTSSRLPLRPAAHTGAFDRHAAAQSGQGAAVSRRRSRVDPRRARRGAARAASRTSSTSASRIPRR